MSPGSAGSSSGGSSYTGSSSSGSGSSGGSSGSFSGSAAIGGAAASAAATVVDTIPSAVKKYKNKNARSVTISSSSKKSPTLYDQAKKIQASGKNDPAYGKYYKQAEQITEFNETHDVDRLLQGGLWMLLGVGALGIAAEVLTGGAATPWVVQALAYTAAASGAATTVDGASEFVEGISDYNLVEDGVFGGNSSAY